MKIPAVLTDPPKDECSSRRYIMLVVLTLLLAWDVSLWLRAPADPKTNQSVGIVMVMGLLLNIVGFDFKWSAAVTAILRLMALTWLILGSAYAVWAFSSS